MRVERIGTCNGESPCDLSHPSSSCAHWSSPPAPRPSGRACTAAAAARHRQRDRAAVSRPEQQPLHRVPGDARGHHHERPDQPRLRALAEGGDRDAVQGAGPLRALHASRLGPCVRRRGVCRHRGVRRPPQHAGGARAAGGQSAAAGRRREDRRQQERPRRAQRGGGRSTASASRCSTTTATTSSAAPRSRAAR